jgi:signal transduction histidine kinase
MKMPRPAGGRVNKISGKLVVILILSALIPLSVFGLVSIWTSREMAGRIVADENLQIARRAAQQIDQYISNSRLALETLAQNLAKTDLQVWQKDRIVKNYAIQFEQFESIDLFDRNGIVTATSRLEKQVAEPSAEEGLSTVLKGGDYRSEVFFSKDFVPSLKLGIPLRVLNALDGGIIGELNLTEMWRLVEGIRIGKEGYAFVVSRSGLLIAHGKGSEKARVLKREGVGKLPIVSSALQGEERSLIYRDPGGVEEIGVSVPIPSLGWALVIEQPTREAYAAAIRMTYQLGLLIAVFLAVMFLVGTAAGKRFIVNPIRELIRATRAVGGGNLTGRVNISTHDEFSELGASFNEMTEHLVALKEDIRRNERAVFLGKIAGGLVHDLKHPVKALENSGRLMLQQHADPKIRELFKEVSARELSNLDRYFDDLLHVARQAKIQPVMLELSVVLDEILTSFRSDARCVVESGETPRGAAPPTGKVRMTARIPPAGLKIRADRFALERVLRNLMLNAVEAMPDGGRVTVSADSFPSEAGRPGGTRITVADTGPGIPPDRVATLFEDFATSKRKGIGLGLAICKKIVDEHHGTLSVESELGRGTTFTLHFPSSG